MKLYDNISLAQARRDLQYMRDTYSNPQDFCGSFCNNNKLDNILMGRTTVKETIIENIEYYFSNGIDTNSVWEGCSSYVKPDMEDPRTAEIAERYYISAEQ